MKYIIFGDLHLGKKTYGILRNEEIYDTFIDLFQDILISKIGDEKFSIVLLGDVFDSLKVDVNSIKTFFNILAETRQNPNLKEVIVVAGNHDCSSLFMNSPLTLSRFVSRKVNIHLRTTLRDNSYIVLPWDIKTKKEEKLEFLRKAQSEIRRRFPIFSHSSIPEMTYGSRECDWLSLCEQQLTKEFEISFFTGHLHMGSREKKVNIDNLSCYLAGSLLPLTFGDVQTNRIWLYDSLEGVSSFDYPKTLRESIRKFITIELEEKYLRSSSILERRWAYLRIHNALNYKYEHKPFIRIRVNLKELSKLPDYFEKIRREISEISDHSIIEVSRTNLSQDKVEVRDIQNEDIVLREALSEELPVELSLSEVTKLAQKVML